MNIQKINLIVEAICNNGCSSVNAIIHTLESGHVVDGIEDLNKDEINTLTQELKAIMAVYECRKK